MSTPSKIILKVRETDKGRKVKFDASKLPLPLEEWVMKDEDGEVYFDQRGKSLCREFTLKGDYIGIYCHWDGYLDSTGKALKDYFNDYETALNLIVGGFCSGIASGHVAHYANRNIEKWANIKPIQGSLEKVRNSIYGQYEYVFVNKWKGKKAI